MKTKFTLKSLAAILAAASLVSPATARPANDESENKSKHFDHVFLIMMENHTFNEIIGDTADAPYINYLAGTGNSALNYYAVGHPSLTNYLEVVGGSNFGITSDNFPDWHGATPSPSLIEPIFGSGTDAATDISITNQNYPPAPYVAETLADQMVSTGRSWRTYQESLPLGGADGVNYSDGVFSNLSTDPTILSNVAFLYAVKHNPFVYFKNVQENTDSRNSLKNVRAFDGDNGLFADLRAGHAPNFSFIVPNQCHDMHGRGNVNEAGYLCTQDKYLIQSGDAAVQRLVEAIKHSDSWEDGNNAIIVMWDENDYSSNPNVVGMIVLTNYGVSRVTSTKSYNHFSLLKTLEAGFGLSCLNHACDATSKVMSDVFFGK